MQPNNSSLTKISQLVTLVDIDKSDHKLKDITELFINSARDWDTFNQTDFDKILKDILSYYEQQIKSIDFIADLKYFTTDEGGRQTPAFSGYRPQVKFDFDEMQTLGQQTFLNKDTVYPGDTVEAAIKIVSVEHFANTLTKEMIFEFREGSRVIGTGRIIAILNERLIKSCR